MVDPVIHAEMTMLIQRENELEEQIAKLDGEIPMWKKRVGLAEQKGMAELADEARERVHQLIAKRDKAQREIDSIDMQKSMLRKQSKRPTGREVERAEALLESVRAAGLVDPDKSKWDDLERQHRLKEESGAVFDFDDED